MLRRREIHQVSSQPHFKQNCDIRYRFIVPSSCQLSLSILKYKNNVTFSIKAFRRLETFLFVRGFHADIAAIPMQGPALLSGDQLGDFHAGLVN